MDNKRKIINDPVFGFLSIPNDFIFDLIEHRYFQRLRRIKQLGVSSFVYPGAQHTRFQHSLGALYLTSEAIKQLRKKGHSISEEEENSVLAAILFHDIGHSPLSHVLERMFIDVSHEQISLKMMEQINQEKNGALDMTIAIFKNKYPKKFLHQLISGQLDMDRMDYLCRDSFFTGVVEGMVGANRIIEMLELVDDSLVVENKGVYSVENLLVSRRFMYWQVYLHKTSLAAERMLRNILQRAKELSIRGDGVFASPALAFFLKNNIDAEAFLNRKEVLEQFANLDDYDILNAVKVWASSSDVILQNLSSAFVNRHLFKAFKPGSPKWLDTKSLEACYMKQFGISSQEAHYFFSEEVVTSNTYNPYDDNIMILGGDGKLYDIAEVSDILDIELLKKRIEKKYLFFMPI